jgi:hypothetical protein
VLRISAQGGAVKTLLRTCLAQAPWCIAAQYRNRTDCLSTHNPPSSRHCGHTAAADGPDPTRRIRPLFTLPGASRHLLCVRTCRCRAEPPSRGADANEERLSQLLRIFSSSPHVLDTVETQIRNYQRARVQVSISDRVTHSHTQFRRSQMITTPLEDALRVGQWVSEYRMMLMPIWMVLR